MLLTERVLERLGFSAPPAIDLAGLNALYAAWCESVPFDNLGKLIALRNCPEKPLPGIDADEFFERWLDHGVGATCWGTANALYELFSDVGFDATRVAGSMRDTGYTGHGSVKVRLDNTDWLVDSSLLTDIPVPLTDEVFVGTGGVYGIESEPSSDNSHLVWADVPPNATLVPCRISVGHADHDFYVERYEASRLRGSFNERLYARRNRLGERIVLSGNTRFCRNAGGTQTDDLNRAEVGACLIDEFGISPWFVERWRESGALEASFQPPSTVPSPITVLPPSRRAHNCGTP